MYKKHKQNIQNIHYKQNIPNIPNKSDKPLKFITENIYDVKNDNYMKNPVHIEPYHIPYLFQLIKHGEKVLITPKADGVPVQVVLNDMLLATEKINSSLEVQYQIIDVVRTSKYNINTHKYSMIDKRLSLLSSYLSHDSKNNVIIPLNLASTNVFDMYTSISTIISNPTELCPNVFIKPLFDIKLDNDTNNTQNTIDTTIKKFIELLFETYTTPYDNDGWIVYVENKNVPLKIKPYHHLTIDLLYMNKNFHVKINNNNDEDKSSTNIIKIYENSEYDIVIEKNESINLTDGTIYRILPVMSVHTNTNTNNFCADTNKHKNKLQLRILSERPDKICANRIDIIQSIMCRIKHQWTPSDILDIYMKNPIIYYDRFSSNKRKDINISTLLKCQKNIIETSICNDITENDTVIIDLGCGNGSFGKLLHKTNKIRSYLGIDIDPVVLGCNIGLPSTMCLVWGNPNNIKYTEYYTSYLKNGYTNDTTTILSINSIHYFDLMTINTLVDDVLKSRSNVKLIIFSFFSENINQLIESQCQTLSYIVFDTEPKPFTISYDNAINDDSVNDNGNDIGKVYRFSYPWRSREFTERIYNKAYVVNTLEKLGWILEHNEKVVMTPSIYKDNDTIEFKLPTSYYSFINLHEKLVFVKKSF